MTRILAIANAKGGVGKTTTINPAACPVERKRRVLAADLDSQASLILSLGLQGDGRPHSIYDALATTGIRLVSIIQLRHPMTPGRLRCTTTVTA